MSKQKQNIDLTSIQAEEQRTLHVWNAGTEVETLQKVSQQLVWHVGDLLRAYEDYTFSAEKDPALLETYLKRIVHKTLRAYLIFGLTPVADPVAELEQMAAETTLPDMNRVISKLVRYSSNVCSCAYAYPETVLESGLNYDLHWLIMFCYIFSHLLGLDMNEILTDKRKTENL